MSYVRTFQENKYGSFSDEENEELLAFCSFSWDFNNL